MMSSYRLHMIFMGYDSNRRCPPPPVAIIPLCNDIELPRSAMNSLQFQSSMKVASDQERPCAEIEQL